MTNSTNATAERMVTIRTNDHGKSPNVYHTRECSNYPGNTRDIPISTAVDEMELDKCYSCSGDAPTASGHSTRDINALVEKLRDQMGVEVQE